MDKIYGNQQLLETISAMYTSDRAAHSVIFYGEKGSGKRMFAKYYTQLLMCESPTDGKPCSVCRSCRNVEADVHPDVMYVPTSGKLGGYSVETARMVRKDAFVKPNNSTGRKVYIFAECRNIDPRTQNTLLKIIEEPPDYAYFLFTTGSKANFLSTIISRCVGFAVSPCTEDEARECLAEHGHSEKEISSAVGAFHGNIGRCMDYLRDEKLRGRVDLTKSLADSIIGKDEYSLNAACFSLGKERGDVREVLSMLDMLVRDAAVLSRDSEAAPIGCSRSGARRLAEHITPGQAAKLHNYIENAWRAVESNVNIPLVLAAMCAEIMETVA